MLKMNLVDLIGKTILNVEEEDDSYLDADGNIVEQTRIIITTTDNKKFLTYRT